MGSLFRYKEWKRLKPPVAGIAPAISVPEGFSSKKAAEELKKPMTAPEVDLGEKLPDVLVPMLPEALRAGCRAFLVEPEEETTRWFGLYDAHLEELAETPVADHTKYLRGLVACVGGAVTLGPPRFRLESFVSFNEFGDRFTLQFFEEGVGDYNDVIALRQQNVRLVNRLKPATSLTAKNERDIVAVVQKNEREASFTDILVERKLVSAETLAKTPQEPSEDYLLRVIKANVFPRKPMASALAHYLDVPYLDLEIQPLDKSLAQTFSEEWELEHQAIPFAVVEEKTRVAMMDPSCQATIEAIAEKVEFPVEVFCAAAQDIGAVVRRAHKKDD